MLVTKDGVYPEDLILNIAKVIHNIEYSGKSNWKTCSEEDRNCAVKQAKAAWLEMRAYLGRSQYVSNKK